MLSDSKITQNMFDTSIRLIFRYEVQWKIEEKQQTLNQLALMPQTSFTLVRIKVREKGS